MARSNALSRLRPIHPTQDPSEQNNDTKHNSIPRKAIEIMLTDKAQQPAHAQKSADKRKDKANGE